MNTYQILIFGLLFFLGLLGWWFFKKQKNLLSQIEKQKKALEDAQNTLNLAKKTEETNKLLQTSINASKDLIFFKDNDLRYIDCNNAFCEFVGKEKDFIIGKSDFELFEPQMAGNFRKQDKKMLKNGKLHSNLEWITYPDGKRVCVEVQKSSFEYKGEKAVFHIARDVTKMIEYQEHIKSSKNLLHTFIEKNKTIMLAIDPEDGRIIESNEKAREFYMYSKKEFENMFIQDINILSEEKINEEMDNALLEKRSFFLFKHRIASGAIKDVQVYSSAVSFEGKKYLFSIILDVTEKLKNEESLKLFANVFSNVDEGIIISNADNKIVDVNKAFTKITGFEKTDVLGKNPTILKSGKHDKVFYKKMWQKILTQEYWSGEIWNRHKNGDIYPERLNISVIKNTNGSVKYFIGLISNISNEKKSEKKLKDIAFNDSLTGLPNRVLFLDQLTYSMAKIKNEGKKLAVVFIDIDGFKSVNDKYGHDIGDKLLIKIAQVMKEMLRSEDSIARIGGDEFVAVLCGVEQESDYIKSITRLLKSIRNIQKVGKYEIDISASIGLAVYPQVQSINADGLLRQADQAMYKAKVAGKNCFHSFDVKEDQSLKEFHKEIAEVTKALKEQQFLLHYQPQVNMREGKIIGVEALIRWEHPQRGLLYPNSFLPLIEENPLSIELGKWVIESVLQQMRKWESLGLHVEVSINISAFHLNSKGFEQDLEELLAKYSDIDPSWIKLEILETSALENIYYVSQVLESCRNVGVRIALDDFGTGYSSLTYLKRLNVDMLKIDKSFVINMLEEEADFSILEGVIGLAKAFETQLIAEGVESKEHGAALIKLGCEVAQGYFIAKAMPPNELPNWVKSWKPEKMWTLQKRVHHADITLMSAMTKHRSWMKDLEHILEYDEYIAINLNAFECKFGLWIKHQGELLYGDRIAFKAVKELHVETHNLGKQLMKLRAEGKKEEARRVFVIIKQKSEQMMENIEFML